MADEKVTAMTPQALIDPTDLLHTIDDVAGVPDNLSLTLSLLLGGEQNIGGNLARNSPGQIVTDGAEPQWWDEGDGNATMTDEDAAGEGIEEKQERVFKVVTIANDKYGYQTLTFADEDLLDAGQTVVSFGCWVWCAAATKASIGIFGTNLTLQESGQHSGGSSWEYFSVENITLNGADADIEIRLIVDTGTAYYCMPMLCVGPVARPWVGRQLLYVPTSETAVVSLAGTGDVARSDADCTAASDNLAVAMQCRSYANEASASNSQTHTGHSDTVMGAETTVLWQFLATNSQYFSSTDLIFSDDTQAIRYEVNEGDADSDVNFYIKVYGYWRWA